MKLKSCLPVLVVALPPVVLLLALATLKAPEVERAPSAEVETPAQLSSLLRARGFEPPKGFKALVVAVELDVEGRPTAERAYDYLGGARESANWNPASTVKLYSAIGALVRLSEGGLAPSSTQVVFHDRRGPRRHAADELVRQALVDSDNIAHNRLVQLAGYDRLNQGVLGGTYAPAAIRRPYARGAWRGLGAHVDLRVAPRITLQQGEFGIELPSTRSSSPTACRARAACTSLADLASAMRRVMLHRVLPPEERYALSEEAVVLLEHSLSARRKRSQGIADRLVAGISGGVAYHKAGYSKGWMSDVLWLAGDDGSRAWIVAFAAHGGRKSLNAAATHIGALIGEGALTPNRSAGRSNRSTPTASTAKQGRGAMAQAMHSPKAAPSTDQGDQG